jgi:hypothetical protein
MPVRAAGLFEERTGVEDSFSRIDFGVWYAKWFPNALADSASSPDVKNSVDMAFLPELSKSVALGRRTNFAVDYVSDRIYRAWSDRLGVQSYKQKKAMVDLLTGSIQQAVVSSDDESIAIECRYTYGKFTGTISTPQRSDFGYVGTKTRPNCDGGWSSIMNIADLAVGYRVEKGTFGDNEYGHNFYGIGVKVIQYEEPLVCGIKRDQTSASLGEYFLTDVKLRSVLVGAQLRQEELWAEGFGMEATAFYGAGKSDLVSPVFTASAMTMTFDGSLRFKWKFAGENDSTHAMIYIGCRILVNGNIVMGGFRAKRSQGLYDRNGNDLGTSLSQGEKADADFSPIDILFGPTFGASFMF